LNELVVEYFGHIAVSGTEGSTDSIVPTVIVMSPHGERTVKCILPGGVGWRISFPRTWEFHDGKMEAVGTQRRALAVVGEGTAAMRFERLDPDQLLLFSLEELQEIAKQLEQGQPDEDLIDVAASQRRRQSPGRVGKLPEHLEREIIRHELSEDERACPDQPSVGARGEVRQEIGVESSEQLELIPASWKVLQHDRVKYACRSCEEHVAIADKPPQPRPTLPRRCPERFAGAGPVCSYGAQQVRRPSTRRVRLQALARARRTTAVNIFGR
jgi:hypothetical protein